MAAEEGDLVYLSDKRKWLGGLNLFIQNMANHTAKMESFI